MRTIISIFIWLTVVFSTLGVFFAVLLRLPFLLVFDRKRKTAHAQGFWWADIIIGLNPFWSYSMEGLENADPFRTYVIVANHQSIGDIAMLYKTHLQFKWVAKESLFHVPIFGWCMSRMKYIRLTRGRYSSIRDAYEEARDWLRQGVSVLFFPEGTRNSAGGLGSFKNGAFKLAVEEKIPVLPVYIGGSGDIIPRGSWIFKNKASCKVTILPAVETAADGPQDFDKLRDHVYQVLSSQAGRK